MVKITSMDYSNCKYHIKSVLNKIQYSRKPITHKLAKIKSIIVRVRYDLVNISV